MIKAILKELGLTRAEVSFLFLDNPGIQKLNRLYFGKDRPTDVISFPQDFPDNMTNPDNPNLGDVVISLEMAREQASRYGKTVWDEIKLLIAHGMLHLIGYDDIKPEEKKRMRRAEKKLVAKVKAL